MLNRKGEKEEIEFIHQLTKDIELLENLISNNTLEKYDRIGAEQEFCIIDENFRANPINEKLVKKVKKASFQKQLHIFLEYLLIVRGI